MPPETSALQKKTPSPDHPAPGTGKGNQPAEGDPQDGGAKVPEGYTDPLSDLDALTREPANSPPEESSGSKADSPPADGAKQDDSPGDTQPDDGTWRESAAYKRSKPLREAYDKLRDHSSTLEKQLAETRAQLETGDVHTALTAENAELRNRIKEYQSRILVDDYEQSDDYQDKFVKPLRSLIDGAVSELEGLEVDEGGRMRKVTKEDFMGLINLNLRDASRLANQMFGEASGHIMALRAQVKQINDARKSAIQNARQNSEQLSQRKLAQEAEAEVHRKTIWETATKKIVERFPDLFGESPDDPKHNELLNKGLQEFDAAIHPNPKVPAETRLTLMAGMRYRAAALPAVVRKLRDAEDRIEELETRLNASKNGDPDGGGDGGSPAQTGTDKYVSAADDPDAPWNAR